MSSFDKDKFETGFKPKLNELEKIQAAELHSLVEKFRASDSLKGTTFYDHRNEMRMRHFKDILDLATHALIGSIPFKSKIDEEETNEFKEILKEIFTSFWEHEQNSLKSIMVSYDETVNTYEKNLNAVFNSALELLPLKIKNHNKYIKIGNAADIVYEKPWKKYSALIVIGFVVVILCIIVLYLII